MTLDVGGVRSGAELAISKERLEVFQGSPRTLVKQYVTSDSIQLTVNGIEWDLKNLCFALGQDSTDANQLQYTTTAAAQTIQFGGNVDMTDVAVLFEHRMPAGATISVSIWKAQGSGDVTTTFGDDLHEIPYVFRALDPSQNGAATSWGGDALPDEGRLCRITKTAQT